MAHTLALNSDGTPLGMLPISTMNWQDSIRAIYLGTVKTIYEYETWTVRSPRYAYRVPAVVMATKYVKVRRLVSFTDDMVFLRDGYRCQYCLNMFHRSKLTLDHVLPKSLGGKRSFMNFVAACAPCNTRRGNDVSIQPANLPRKPNYHELVSIRRTMPLIIPHASWNEFLGWDDSLVRVVPPDDEPGFLPKSQPMSIIKSLIEEVFLSGTEES
jgi:5-methylcytosine-specific restriction endonuclease McrA